MSFGEPQDKEGECNARLFVGDNFGDNHVTFRCSMPAGHEGPHHENYITGTGGEVMIQWVKDMRGTADDPDRPYQRDCLRWIITHPEEMAKYPGENVAIHAEKGIVAHAVELEDVMQQLEDAGISEDDIYYDYIPKAAPV